MRVSIVIPFYNESDAVDAFLQELILARPNDEVIAVNDGSTDDTLQKLKSFPNIRIISHDHRKGQSSALWSGVRAASEHICVLMDGDGEFDPGDIEPLVRELNHSDFCCGYRVDRKSSFSSRAASRIANIIRRFVTGDSAKDTGAMKAVRTKHILAIPFFDGIHRYIPAFLESAGLKISQIPLTSRKRFGGTSKYGILNRAWKGIFDLARVKRLITNKKANAYYFN